MADQNNKDVRLRIRAEDYSKKTLAEVVEALNKLVAAQEEQREAAKRGEVSAAQLEASYQKLEKAAKALLSQSALIEVYRKQEAEVAKLAEATEAARKAHSEFANTLVGAEKVSKKQESQLNRLANAVTRAEKAEQRRRNTLEGTVAKLNEAGIQIGEFEAAQRQIAQAVSTANASLERQEQALSTVEADIRRAKQAAEEQAEAARKQAQAEREAAAAAERAARQKAEAEREAARMREQIIAYGRKVEAENQRLINEAIAAAQRRAAEEEKVRQKIEAEKKAQEELNLALNKAADHAMAQAKGYRTLATSIDAIDAKELSREIASVLDPTMQAIKSLDGLEAALKRNAHEIAGISGPIKNYKDHVAELGAVSKSIGNMAGLIDAFRHQEQAARQAREELDRVEQEIQQLTGQMRAGTGSLSDFNRMLNDAQNRMRQAAINARNHEQALAKLDLQLKQAGIDTKDLAGAQERLTIAAERAASATRQLGDAHRRYGVEVEKSGNALHRWWNDSRTALSFTQRLRGEILSLTTTYVGLYGAIESARGALEAVRSRQQIRNRLAIVVGTDTSAIDEEWEYLMGQADRLGFGFEALAESYSKFAVAARANNLTLQETRYIFERLAEAGRGAGLSTDDFARVMRATEQMLNKGKILAEELTQQMGDALPGAFAMAARGANMSMAEFTKAMEEGEITAEYVINLAREAGETYADAFALASDSMAAAEGRLQNAIYQFKLALADNGFTDAYIDFIKELTEVLNSDEGRQLAMALSDLFSQVANALRWCAENIDLVKAAFAGLVGVVSLKYFMQMASLIETVAKGFGKIAATGAAVSGITSLTGAFDKATRAMGMSTQVATKLSRALSILGTVARIAGRAIPVVGAGLMAYEAYRLLNPDVEAPEPRQPSEPTPDPGTGGSESLRTYRAILEQMQKEEERTLKMMNKTAKKAAEDDLEQRLEVAGRMFEELKEQARGYITDQQQLAEALEAIEKAKNNRLEAERIEFERQQAEREERSGMSRVMLAQQVARELERIEDELAKRDAMGDPNTAFEERLRARVAFVAHEYNSLQKTIDRLAQKDPELAANARARLNEYIKYRQELETVRAKNEELSRLEGKLNALVTQRGAIMENLRQQLENGLITQDQYRAAVAETNNELGDGIRQAGEAVRSFAESMRDLLDPVEFETLMTRINTTIMQNNAAMLNAADRLVNAQTDLNNLEAERNRLIQLARTQYELGLITEKQMVDSVNSTNAAYKERLVALAEAVRLQALEVAAENPARAEELRELAAELDNFILKTQNARLETTELHRVFVDSFANNAVNAFDEMAQSIAQVILGQQEMGDMWKQLGVTTAQFFAQLLRDLAVSILRMQILNMLRNSGNPYIAAAAGAMMTGGQYHNGGLVGMSGNHTRPWVADIPRYHQGGVVGLAPNEQAAILQKGEEVLTRDDPRHILNGGGGGADPSAYRFVLVDDRASMADAMAGAEGEKVILQHLRRNVPTLKQMLR